MTHPPKPPPLMRAPKHPGLSEQLLDQLVDGRHGDPVVGGQAAMPLGHHGAQPAEVAPGQQTFRFSHPGALGDHVTGPPAQHRIGQRTEVAERAEPERPAEDVRGPLALGAPGGVGAVGEEAGHLAVHDHERRLVGHGHRTRLEGLEVDAERVAGGGAGDGEGIEQADVRARAALGLLAVAGQCEGVGVVAEGQQQCDREGGARGEAGTDRDRARHPGDPAARRGLRAQEPGRQGRLGAHRGGVAQHDLDGSLRKLVRVDPDQEAARLGREVDLRGQLDGHRQREPAVVVGVVADDGHSSGGAGGRHAPQLGTGGGRA